MNIRILASSRLYPHILPFSLHYSRITIKITVTKQNSHKPYSQKKLLECKKPNDALGFPFNVKK